MCISLQGAHRAPPPGDILCPLPPFAKLSQHFVGDFWGAPPIYCLCVQFFAHCFIPPLAHQLFHTDPVLQLHIPCSTLLSLS